MDMTQTYLVSGYVNGRDEKQNPIYLTLLGTATRYDLLSLDILAGGTKVDLGMPLGQLVSSVRKAKGDAPQNSYYEELEQRLKQFVEDRRFLQTLAKNRNIKTVERALNRFCNESMDLHSVAFLQMRDLNNEELLLVLNQDEVQLDLEDLPDPVTALPAEEPGTPEDTGNSPPAASENKNEEKEQKDIFIRCDAVLDPVNGIAVSDLLQGDVISVSLQSNSTFYKLMSSQTPDFRGVIQAEVKAVLENETGSFTVSLDVAEGISGMMKLNSRARVKTLRRWNEPETGTQAKVTGKISKGDFLFGIAGFMVLIALFLLIFYVIHKAF